MSADIKTHIRKEILIGGISNMIFNGLIAWLLLRGGEPLGWTGAGNFTGDVLATAFILPFIVTAIVVPLHKSKIAKGKMQPSRLSDDSTLQSIVDRMPAGTAMTRALPGPASSGVNPASPSMAN